MTTEAERPIEPDRVRAPNIRDVARVAGVSYQTVSRVLNDSPNIRPETLQRVRDAIDELGYRPNQAARALVTSRSRTIGVLAAQTVHYGPATSIQAIETAAREAGYRLSITNISSSEYASIKSGLDYLMSQAVEALIVIAPQVRVFEAIHDLQVGVPFVTLEATGLSSDHSLWVDQVQGARMATRHLIELGHTEIMHISGPQDWIEAEARMQGFLRELGDADLRTRAPILGDWTASFGYYAGLELLRYRDFTAVFAGNDQMALGFMHACREMGLSVPGDISIVGFDDVPEAAHFAPPLTTVRQNFAEIGRRAIALLLGELRGETDLSHDPVQPELIIRESTARASRLG
ncbi:LacI family DNA-binding transcriptional regulator [Microcella frigidaquae]|uniref:DNA-binding LacI/PurR family transcriptional regulator n=1 Tax=Microcella frigidaquae TaxID=424758 RepID=A0A840XR00_9MICO|nr:LacI family DNA-binding transcriptional regulator [Microcella frigidaquae]MBB5618359.1 DNA-binding LacI/PurR family transcriptional regulator [Microcella frigidaquae]NHN44737.1 LacI family DNA-binding transcriptional regulator [Microcella frigidaquae]